ncbi:MAG: hypothetical protein ACP5G7_00620 [Anaerolineae bacterium]
MNIIDTLTAGFDTVRRNPWLLLLPILLDVFLWLGPKLSIAPIVEETIVAFEEMQQTLNIDPGLDAALSAMPEFDPTFLRETAGRANLLAGLVWGVLGVPSVAATRLIAPTDHWIIELSGGCAALGLLALIIIAGLFLATLYLALAGRMVRGDGEPLGKTIRALPRYALYIVMVLLPIVLVTAVAMGLSFLCGPFTFLLLGAALWLGIYLYFAPEAITMSHAEPLEAVRNSMILLRTAFWPTLGFIVLCTVIGAGMSVIWQNLLTSPLGIAVAIPVNAFVGTGLTAATFIYYRERLSLWHSLVAQARAHSQTEDSPDHD